MKKNEKRKKVNTVGIYLQSRPFYVHLFYKSMVAKISNYWKTIIKIFLLPNLKINISSGMGTQSTIFGCPESAEKWL